MYTYVCIVEGKPSTQIPDKRGREKKKKKTYIHTRRRKCAPLKFIEKISLSTTSKIYKS